MADMIIAESGQPGCRQITGVTAVMIRHFPGDTSARDAVQAQAMTWSNMAGALTGQDPYLAWRGPQEMIALGLQSEPLHTLLHSLAPGRSDSAIAVDLSEALAVFELHGPLLDVWLSHLVDAMAIPRQPGRVSRCRLAEAPVLLLRLDLERVWLVADWPIAAYLSNWLVHSHKGAFAADS